MHRRAVDEMFALCLGDAQEINKEVFPWACEIVIEVRDREAALKKERLQVLGVRDRARRRDLVRDRGKRLWNFLLWYAGKFDKA